jgi:hypothetical protein
LDEILDDILDDVILKEGRLERKEGRKIRKED